MFTSKKAEHNRVNLNYCHDFKNVGDNIAPTILEYVAGIYGINPEQAVNGTYHLFTVGSIITAGAQDCTIWGSGLLNTKILDRLNGRKLDIRSVRGPVTRAILEDRGYQVPPVYGDPAILMPLIYNPESIEKRYHVSVVTHMDEKGLSADDERLISEEGYHKISIVTDDYKSFINQILESELVISSSLHGIIFAEAYGVKAVLLKPKTDMLKYFDYYFGTKRFDFPIAESIEQALNVVPVAIPDFSDMQKKIIEVFPRDLWDK